MKFKLFLLCSALCTGAFATEKPVFAPTDYFTEKCLAEFPREEFRNDVINALNEARQFRPERLRLLEDLKRMDSPRYAAVDKRAQIQDSLISYMERRLAADTSESLLFAWSSFEELHHFVNYFRAECQLLKEQQSAPPQKNFFSSGLRRQRRWEK